MHHGRLFSLSGPVRNNSPGERKRTSLQQEERGSGKKKTCFNWVISIFLYLYYFRERRQEVESCCGSS